MNEEAGIAYGEVISLNDAIPDSWRSNTIYDAVLLTLFPSGLWGGSISLGVLDKLNEVGLCIAEHPARMMVISIETNNEVYRVDSVHRYSDGQRIVEQHVKKVPVPKGQYLVAMSPMARRSDGSLDEATAAQSIEFFRGVVTAGLGHSAALRPVFSYHSKLRESGMSFVGEVVENHIPPDAHGFLDEQNLDAWVRSLEIHLPPELAQRARVAFRILGVTAGLLDPLVRLLNTWVALEVAAGSSGNAERFIRQVAGANGEQIAKRFKDARDNFMHRGTTQNLSREDERIAKAAIFFALSQYHRKPVVRIPVASTGEVA